MAEQKVPVHLESFELDHERVRAPYVRLAARHVGRGGDVVTKFDLRLVQPNEAAVPTAALHTLEHLLAGSLRSALQGEEVVDVSPMGCRTGFYLTVLGDPAEERVRAAFVAALRDVAAHEGPVPGAARRTCGNWRDHDLTGARAWAASVLEREVIVQETVALGAP